MLNRLSRYWRVLATGFSFLTFGVGGLLLRIVVFPLINAFVWKKQTRIILARSVIRIAFRGFCWLDANVGSVALPNHRTRTPRA